jgi:hypothetical protein
MGGGGRLIWRPLTARPASETSRPKIAIKVGIEINFSSSSEMTMPIKLSMIYLKHRTKQTMDAGAGRTENIDGLQRDSNNPCVHGIVCALLQIGFDDSIQALLSLQPEQIATSTTNVQFALDRR